MGLFQTKMQAIQTRYLGPTNTLGSRIKARCERGSLTVQWDYGMGVEANHRAAVVLLLEKFAREDVAKYGGELEAHHWGEFVTGELPDGRFAHVLTGGARSPNSEPYASRTS